MMTGKLCRRMPVFTRQHVGCRGPTSFVPDAAATVTQIATAATFSAASLEAVRMLLASLERPDGSLASPVRGDLAVALPTVALLLPAIIPAAAAGV